MWQGQLQPLPGAIAPLCSQASCYLEVGQHCCLWAPKPISVRKQVLIQGIGHLAQKSHVGNVYGLSTVLMSEQPLNKCLVTLTKYTVRNSSKLSYLQSHHSLGSSKTTPLGWLGRGITELQFKLRHGTRVILSKTSGKCLKASEVTKGGLR